jgi:hypothetical protein
MIDGRLHNSLNAVGHDHKRPCRHRHVVNKVARGKRTRAHEAVPALPATDEPDAVVRRSVRDRNSRLTPTRLTVGRIQQAPSTLDRRIHTMLEETLQVEIERIRQFFAVPDDEPDGLISRVHRKDRIASVQGRKDRLRADVTRQSRKRELGGPELDPTKLRTVDADACHAPRQVRLEDRAPRESHWMSALIRQQRVRC